MELLKSLMQAAERSKRTIKAAPDNLRYQLESFGDWPKLSATSATPDVEAIREKAVEAAMDSMAPVGATVFHGSGRLFEPTVKNKLGEFMRKYIGTGEGNAAFGHGTAYVADSKKVASEYYEKLGEAIPIKERIDEYVTAADSIAGSHGKNVADRLYAAGMKGSRKAEQFVVNNLLSSLRAAGVETNYFSDATPAVRAQLIDLLERVKAKPMKNYSGALYKLDMNDEVIAKGAQWNKPMEDQPKAVIDAFSSITGLDEGNFIDTFGQRYNSLADEYGGTAGLYGKRRMDKGKELLSALLEQRGVPGINYLDGLSRRASAADKTYNHVVFDPEDLVILELLK